jgi:CBS domain-containing protein
LNQGEVDAMSRRLEKPQQPEAKGNRWPYLLGGIGAGTALAYLLDPVLGRKRRSRARDKLVHAAHEGTREVRRAECAIANRAQGLLARVRASFRPEPATDEVIRERVRSALGRSCSHAGALEVSVTDGAVVLSGPILAREHARLLRDASRVRGVRAVHDQLTRHVHPSSIPGLQGGRARAPAAATRVRGADLMKREVRVIGEDDTVSRAAELMTMANVGFLPVCDRQRRVIGTLTDRDVVVRVIARDRSPGTCLVGDVMTRDVVACRADDDISLAELAMAQRQVSRLLVTSADGTLEGVISLSDIAAREPARRAASTLRAVAFREAQRV